MTLTKGDLRSIQEVVHEEVTTVVGEKIQASQQHILAEMDKRFIAQGKNIAQGFTDLKAVMENTYVSREEFEQVKEDLQNEVDELRKELQSLKNKIATA